MAAQTPKGNMPVVVLKDDASQVKGREAQKNNIAAAKIIAEIVHTSLGPKGMDKMLVDSLGDVTITNDGATILKEIDVQHPAAKMLVEISKTTDNEVGDGTTSAVVLAGALLEHAETLVLQDVHPTIIVDGYRKAGRKAKEFLDQIADNVSPTDNGILLKIAKTSMQTKLVRKDSGITSTSQFKSGISACTNIGTTTELNMRDFFNSKGISYEPVAFEKADEVVAAYDAGRCDTYTTDKSGLAAQRTKMKDPDAHIVLPETISKEPLGPVVRQGDSVWEDIVRWSLNVMIEAEEYGVNSANADSMKTSDNPAVKRLVGAEGELGAAFGLDNEWSLRIIKQVGNYGESYKRNIADTGILPDRGPNELWTKGGILYVPPAR